MKYLRRYAPKGDRLHVEQASSAVYAHYLCPPYKVAHIYAPLYYGCADTSFQLYEKE